MREENYMKKKISLITALALAASILTGCSESTESESISTESNAQSSTPATVSDTSSTVSSVDSSSTENNDSAPTETEQAPTEETEQEFSFPTSVNYTLIETPIQDKSNSETNPERIYLEGYRSESDTYYATLLSQNENDMLILESVILNPDFSIKEKLDRSTEIYPLYDVMVIKGDGDERTLVIKGKSYSEKKGEVTFGDNVIIMNEHYYTYDGDKLDIPYHGEFYDGKCFYTEDGKTLCMDLAGNVTDYTNIVKPITDQGKNVVALIENKFYVDNDSYWYDMNLVDMGYYYGKPIRDSYGKYTNGNQAMYISSTADKYGKYISRGYYEYVDSDYYKTIVDLSTGHKLCTGIEYEFGADKKWEDKTNLRRVAQKISKFVNGVALVLDYDYNVYFVNGNYEKVSDTILTVDPFPTDDGNVFAGFYFTYLGNNMFAFQPNDQSTYLICIND